MSSIDERVVSMKFDNSQFANGVKKTLSDLDALSKGLKLDGATKGLQDIDAAGKKINLSSLGDQADNVAHRFNAMAIVVGTAIATITHQVVIAGEQMIKSLTIDPIMGGFENYETQIKAVQTILANTAASGTKLADVNKVLSELNTYANQTVYNFGDMTSAIGTFTAAGVGLQTSAESIKGIANLAAMSGASSQQASSAMYQLSQAIAAGSVKLQDWNSVVNAGLGGKTFQDALIQTARTHGVAVDAMIKKNGSFRESLQEGWITSQILTETLSHFTGDLSDAQLRSMGYSEKQAQQILAMGQTAVDAATKIKTMSQLTEALGEEVSTAWAAVFKTLFGDINQATDLFSAIHNVAENDLTAPIYAFQKVLQGWSDLGGRTKLIEALSNAFKDLGAFLKPIGEAFREVFPPATAQQLYNLTVAIDDFTKKLKIGATTSDELRRTFAGLFSILGIGWDILKEVVKVVFELFGVATEGTGSILKFTAGLGDWIVKLREALENGDKLNNFFKDVEKVIAVPIRLIKDFVAVLIGLGLGIASISSGGIEQLVKHFEPLGSMGSLVASVWSKVGPIFESVHKAFAPLAQEMGDFFRNLAQNVESSISHIDYNKVLDTVNTGLFAGLLALLHKFINNFKLGDLGEGFLGPIKESFESLTGTLQAMQKNLQADTLMKIAIAIGVLTVSVVALSFIDSKKLTTAVAAIGGMFAELIGAFAAFDKASGWSSAGKLVVLAAGLTILAVAIDLLAIAVAKLASLDWDGLAKGLTGLGVILGALVATMQLMPDDKKMISAGIGLTALAIGVNILVNAVTNLSGLSWEEMAKGLTGVAALLVSLALFTKFSDAEAGGIGQGIGLILLATGVQILGNAVTNLSGLSWSEIARGLVAMAGAMAIMTAALALIPPDAPLGAAGVLLVAISLKMVGDALAQMGGLSWGEIGKGLTAMLGAFTIIAAALFVIPPTAALGAAGFLIVALSLKSVADVLDQMAQLSWEEIGKAMTVLAGTMFIIAGALLLMIDALPGAAAVLVVAASLAILAPILQMFGNMSWEEMGKGLLMLAGVFVVLGAAGLLLTPVVPTLLGLGLAVTLLGVGMLAAGAGVLAFSIGLTALSVAGAAGAAAIVGIVSALLGLIPEVMTEIGLGIVAFAKVIATAGPAITAAITTVLLALINAIIILTPKIQNTLTWLLLGMLNILANYVPQMVSAGLRLVIGILNGVAQNLGGVITAATNVAVAFLNGIANNQGRIIQSGVNLIISFVNGLANAIRSNSSAMGAAGGNLASAIIEGMANGLFSGVGRVISAAKNVAESALNAAMSALGINSPSKEFHQLGEYSSEGYANGLDALSGVVERSAAGVGKTAIDSLTNSISGIGDAFNNTSVDLNPKITPVLDLSNVKKDAGQLKDMFTANPIAVQTTYSQAVGASVDYKNNQTLAEAKSAPTTQQDVTFIQNNTSPKALSSADIYRQTKNQLSVAKEALANA